MGLNVDLCHMLGLASEMQCPSCTNLSPTPFGNYDIETPGTNPEPGKWVLLWACSNCDREWHYQFKIDQKYIKHMVISHE